MNEIGKILMFVGFALILAGAVIFAFGKIPGFGRLPGDIFIKKENFTFYFPLATCLLISAVISLIIYLWQRK